MCARLIGFTEDEIRSECLIALLKVQRLWKAEKGQKFRTYAFQKMVFGLKDAVRTHFGRKGGKRTISLDFRGDDQMVPLSRRLPDRKAETVSDVSRFELSPQFSKAFKTLPSKQREVLTQLFGLRDGIKRTAAEVASEIGCSQTFVSQLKKSALKNLRESLDSAAS